MFDYFNWFTIGQRVHLDYNKSVVWHVSDVGRELIKITRTDLAGEVTHWVGHDRLIMAKIK